MLKLTFIFGFVVVACHGFNVATRNQVTNLYYVYTRDNPRSPQSVLATEPSIKASYVDGSVPTFILVHGHSGSAFTSLNPVVKDALLMNATVHVIVVDWSENAGLSYSIATSSVPLVAQHLVTFINLLVEHANIKIADLHLVGFDLGAHVVGIAGRLLRAQTTPAAGTVGRITGLDPSGNGWGINSDRLRITDASYVEVIHTDGRGFFSYGIGTPLGNIDFFANGGRDQPGCFSHSCCHDRAFELFAASMINPRLVGYPCDSMTQLNFNSCRGLPVRLGTTDLFKSGAGIYRANTRRNYPF